MPLFSGTERAYGRKKQRFLEFRQPSMPAKLFVSVQLTTKTEPTPNNPLVLDNTRYQRNAVMQPLAAQLGIRLWRGRGHQLSGTKEPWMAPQRPHRTYV